MSGESLWLYVLRPFVSLALLGCVVVPIAWVVLRIVPHKTAVRLNRHLTEQEKVLAMFGVFALIILLGSLLSH